MTFILGGARSGKSRHAEALARKYKGPKTYIATAEAIDAEMRERIAMHRSRRGAAWITREAPLDLVAALMEAKTGFILIDCITVWIGNLMHHGRDVRAEVGALFDALKKSKSRVAVVSNEVGLGIVPENTLARAFRDEQGFANQRIAEISDTAIFIAAGLPITLKKASRRQAPRRRAGKVRGRKA
ncbi:MAG: bifunctional adenosylcobinamide kinase/adenosylcobinamide-phosphate guanylyltransferase [Hyphomicrobiales bacterium]